MISFSTFKRGKLLIAALSAWLMPVTGNAQSLCVQLMSDCGIAQSVPVRLGSTLHLSFRHSIYGSQIEEVFALRRAGLELIQLRYGEARLVDFYGYENAEHKNGLWVVTPTPTLLPSLNLMLSADASMSLHFDRHANSKQLVIQPGSALRLTVATCENSADD
jgi:hypothetical protein